MRNILLSTIFAVLVVMGIHPAVADSETFFTGGGIRKDMVKMQIKSLLGLIFLRMNLERLLQVVFESIFTTHTLTI